MRESTQVLNDTTSHDRDARELLHIKIRRDRGSQGSDRREFNHHVDGSSIDLPHLNGHGRGCNSSRSKCGCTIQGGNSGTTGHMGDASLSGSKSRDAYDSTSSSKRVICILLIIHST